MTTVRIALGNLQAPATREQSVELALAGIAETGRRCARAVLPECFIPGYRWPGATMPPPDALPSRTHARRWPPRRAAGSP